MRAIDPRRWLDARQLMWVTAAVFGSGLLLLVGFDGTGTGPNGGRDVLRGVLRSVHALASVLLIVGVGVHAVARVVRGTAAQRAIQSGAVATGALGLAAVSGAMMARSADAEALVEAMGLAPWGQTARVAASVFHLAYAAVLVVLGLYWHIGRIRPARVFGPVSHGLATVALVLGAGVLLAGDLARQGHPATWALAPPLPGFWSWTLVASLASFFAAGALARRSERRPATPGQASPRR